LDRETLALIWAGNVSSWNDERIQKLNPDIASKLPNQAIVLGYNDNFVLSVTELLKLALESYSSDFASAFAAANRTFGNMPWVSQGRGEVVGGSNTLRLAWVKVSQGVACEASLMLASIM
jgi:hypothetical protein